jgi:proline racemase
MADSKVSELTAATSVGGSDTLYLVQTNTSKKVTAATLFASAANVTLSGNVNFESGVQLLASPGIIDLKKPVTHLSSDASGGTIVIPAGTVNQVKIIAMISTAGGTYTIRSNVANSANVVFNNVGDTATMMYTNNKWFVIGGTASLT